MRIQQDNGPTSMPWVDEVSLILWLLGIHLSVFDGVATL